MGSARAYRRTRRGRGPIRGRQVRAASGSVAIASRASDRACLHLDPHDDPDEADAGQEVQRRRRPGRGRRHAGASGSGTSRRWPSLIPTRIPPTRGTRYPSDEAEPRARDEDAGAPAVRVETAHEVPDDRRHAAGDRQVPGQGDDQRDRWRPAALPPARSGRGRPAKKLMPAEARSRPSGKEDLEQGLPRCHSRVAEAEGRDGGDGLAQPQTEHDEGAHRDRPVRGHAMIARYCSWATDSSLVLSMSCRATSRVALMVPISCEPAGERDERSGDDRPDRRGLVSAAAPGRAVDRRRTWARSIRGPPRPAHAASGTCSSASSDRR